MKTVSSTTNVAQLLGESEHLKDFSVKAWLRKLSKQQESIKPKYLMNE